MAKTWLYALLTAGALIQFPAAITILYGLPDPAAILLSFLALFVSIMTYDVAMCTNQMSFLFKMVRYFFSPLSYVATVHHGQFTIIISSGLLALVFAMDPLSSIRKLSRLAGKYTAWYTPSHHGDLEMAFAIFIWIGTLIATPLYFIEMW